MPTVPVFQLLMYLPFLLLLVEILQARKFHKISHSNRRWSIRTDGKHIAKTHTLPRKYSKGPKKYSSETHRHVEIVKAEVLVLGAGIVDYIYYLQSK